MSQNTSPPSDWVSRWCGAIKVGGRVLDVACGSGRHARLLLEREYRVQAVDLDISGLADLKGRPNFELLQADLENAPWPFGDDCFDGIVVTNYLYRPLFSRLIASLKPGGVLIYETFAKGNGEFGRPSNPDFLLRPGELLAALNGSSRVIAYEDVYVESPKPALVQRICATRLGGPARYFPVLGN